MLSGIRNIPFPQLLVVEQSRIKRHQRLLSGVIDGKGGLWSTFSAWLGRWLEWR
jgi:hypothetical protein